MNDRNIEFLTKIYQNARMGCESISYVSDKSKDENFKSALLKQYNEYDKIAHDAAEMLGKNGEPAKEKGPVTKAMLWSGVQMNTVTDKTPDHIAEMMIQGSIMGVIDMTRSLKRYGDTEAASRKIGERLIETEENNIQNMKAFLC